MTGTVNKVILLGNLEKAPEIRRFEKNRVLAKFTLLTIETFVDQETKTKREVKEFHHVSCWNDLALLVEKNVREGAKIYVEGRLRTRSWQDKENRTHYISEILADTIDVVVQSEKADERKTPYPNDQQKDAPTPLSNELLNFDEDDEIPF